MTIINFPIGARVRSYDFPGFFDTFIEGTVLAAFEAAGHYEIAVERIVTGGIERSVPEGRVVNPPLNGQDGLFGPTKGVVAA